MTWVKLDDKFYQHPKVAGLTDKAFRLHVSGLCFTAQYDLDGEVPPTVLGSLRGTPKLVEELVTANLWETTSRGSWVIHDYLVYNRSKLVIEAERLRKAEGGKRGADNRWGVTDAMGDPMGDSIPPVIGSAMPPFPSRPVPFPSPETTNPTDSSSLSTSGEREIFETAITKLPQKYQRDALTIDEMEAFARDFHGQHIELAEAISECRRNNELCFAGNLRKYMPGGKPNGRNGARPDPNDGRDSTQRDPELIRLRALGIIHE